MVLDHSSNLKDLGDFTYTTRQDSRPPYCCGVCVHLLCRLLQLNSAPKLTFLNTSSAALILSSAWNGEQEKPIFKSSIVWKRCGKNGKNSQVTRTANFIEATFPVFSETKWACHEASTAVGYFAPVRLVPPAVNTHHGTVNLTWLSYPLMNDCGLKHHNWFHRNFLSSNTTESRGLFLPRTCLFFSFGGWTLQKKAVSIQNKDQLGFRYTNHRKLSCEKKI